MIEKGNILQNRYRITRELGRGGMGAVYEAEDNQRFGKPVALKEILLNLTNKNSEHFRRAFEREAKILTQIDHEAVPKVIGYILESDCQILVMELIEGEDLDEILEREKKPFSLKNILDWSDQLLDALDYLHTLKQPIIHRDIKPQNLKLTSRGKIKLLDFGIAKDTDMDITLTNMPQKTFVGATLYYSPIEQIIRIPDYFEMLASVYPEKSKKIVRQSADARSDIYALGATLYHLLTNNAPRPAHLRALELWAEREDSLTSPNVLNPEIPLEISNCLLKAMEIERKNRFASALEMQAALQEAVSHEKRRREEEERNLWYAKQIEKRRELEAEHRKLDKKSDSEADRKKEEDREYEAKLKKWQSEYLPDNTDKEKSAANTVPLVILPSVENASEENTSYWTELAEKKSLTSPPSYLDNPKFKSEKPQTASATIENVKPQTAPDVSAPIVSPKQPLWILPVAVIAFLIFGVAAMGMFLIFNISGSGSADNSVKNPDTVLPTALPIASPTVSLTISPTISPTDSPSVLPNASPAKNVSEKDKTKETVAPTINKTPMTQNPVKTSTPVRIQKPKPTQDPNCVFTNSCK